MENKLDLSWGEPVVVRQTLDEYYKAPLSLDVVDMKYEQEAGNPELIKLVRDYLEKETLTKYKHIIITAGTNQAINILLRVFKATKCTHCITNSLFFPYYSEIIKKNQYIHSTNFLRNDEYTVHLLDYPSNPEGEMRQVNICKNIIWDAVYYNKVYMNSAKFPPVHDVLCGSMSKVFGLTGLRIGWIATDNKYIYSAALKENTYETCTVSRVGQEITLDVLKRVDYDQFSKVARERINDNRSELSKISYLLNGKDVPLNGMFYSGAVDNKAFNLIESANVKFVTLNEYKNYSTIRFNLAQDRKITANAVKSVLKKDGK